MADTKNVLTATEAQQRIREILSTGYVTIMPHCRKSMAYRHYIDSDVASLLLHGRVREPPKYDKKHKNWKCIVEGRIEGEKTTLVVAFPSDDELVCVTIFFEYD